MNQTEWLQGTTFGVRQMALLVIGCIGVIRIGGAMRMVHVGEVLRIIMIESVR